MRGSYLPRLYCKLARVLFGYSWLLNFLHPPTRHLVPRAITKDKAQIGVVFGDFNPAAIFQHRLGLAGEDEEEEAER